MFLQLHALLLVVLLFALEKKIITLQKMAFIQYCNFWHGIGFMIYCYVCTFAVFLPKYNGHT